MKKLMFLFPILCLAACETSVPNIDVEVLTDEVSVVAEKDEFVCGRDKVKDADGNEYKTAYFDIEGGHDVEKDGQCWMAENLNVGTKILNPGEEPSDDGVIEKWCMTDDWSADYITECDYGGGGSRPDICKERTDRRIGGEVKSIKENCEGEGKTLRRGGLYSWKEAMDNKYKICPADWELPSRQDWIYLEGNVRKGITYDEFIDDYPIFDGHPGFKKKIPVAFYLMEEPFNGLMVGIYARGQMVRKDTAVKFLSGNSGPTLLEIFSNGNPTLEREVQYVNIFNKNSDEDAYSIRCMKK